MKHAISYGARNYPWPSVQRDSELLTGTRKYCKQCGKPMNSVEWMLGSVCGKCVRKNHREVAA